MEAIIPKTAPITPPIAPKTAPMIPAIAPKIPPMTPPTTPKTPPTIPMMTGKRRRQTITMRIVDSVFESMGLLSEFKLK